MNVPKKTIIGLLIVATALNIPAFCFGNDAADNLKKTIESIAVPESPAFSVLNVTPDKIVMPANGRELALGLLQGVDDKGNFQNGLAIDFSPYLLAMGKDFQLSDYRSSPVKQILAHTQVSLGSSKGSSSNDKSVRLATGLRVTVFDLGDPRMDTVLGKCINEKQAVIFKKYPPMPPNTPAKEVSATLKKMETETEELVKQCRDESAKRNLNKPALDMGLSPVWSSADGDTKNLDWSGLAVWSSFKYGYEDLLVMVNAKYRSKDQRSDPLDASKTTEGDVVSVGGKLRYGSASTGVLLQGIYTHYSPRGRQTISEFLYSLGGEIKIADNLWLQASAGSTAGSATSKSAFVSGQFKWAISEKAALK